jgi:hypothetical protein
MAVSRKKRVAIAIVSAMVLSAAVAVLLLPQEPKYKGVTSHEWLQRTNDAQQVTALHTLGTNNLSLFVRRFTYDPTKDKAIASFRKLLQPFTVKPVERFLSRKRDLAYDAFLVLHQLGPLASPAIPQLVNTATNANLATSLESFRLLRSIGDEAVPALVALTGCTSSQTASFALVALDARTSSPEVRQALTNALVHPDPDVRKLAQIILK